MSIMTCPTSGEACNHIPFDTDEMPAFVEKCKTRPEGARYLIEFCGFYVSLAENMKAYKDAIPESVVGGNE